MALQGPCIERETPPGKTPEGERLSRWALSRCPALGQVQAQAQAQVQAQVQAQGLALALALALGLGLVQALG